MRPEPHGHIVKEYDIPGGPHIAICDDYCRDITPAEIEAWKKRMARIIAKGYIREYERKIRG